MAGEQDKRPQDGATGEREISVTDARAGQRVGLIWVLLISLALAAIALLGYSTLNSRHMSTAADGSGSNQATPAKAQNFSAPVSEPVTVKPDQGTN